MICSKQCASKAAYCSCFLGSGRQTTGVRHWGCCQSDHASSGGEVLFELSLSPYKFGISRNEGPQRKIAKQLVKHSSFLCMNWRSVGGNPTTTKPKANNVILPGKTSVNMCKPRTSQRPQSGLWDPLSPLRPGSPRADEPSSPSSVRSCPTWSAPESVWGQS